MEEYISREAAIKAMRGKIQHRYLAGDGSLTGKLVSMRGATERIRKCKAADVAPVVRGFWLAWETEENVFECDQCHEIYQLLVGTPTDNKYNFCPNCGAQLNPLYKKEES